MAANLDCWADIRLPPPPAPSHPSRPASTSHRSAPQHHRKTFSSSHLPPLRNEIHPLRQHPVPCARPNFADFDDQPDPTEFEDILLEPTPIITENAARTTYQSIPQTDEPEPESAQDPNNPLIPLSPSQSPTTHTRSQTATSFFDSYKLPGVLARSRSSVLSQLDKGNEHKAQTSSSVNSDEIKENRRSKNSKFLQNWFDGKSAPISLGILPSPTREKPKEELDEEYYSGSETGSEFQTDSESESEDESEEEDSDLSSSEDESDSEDSASEDEDEEPRRHRRRLSMFSRAAKASGPAAPQLQRGNTGKFSWFTKATSPTTPSEPAPASSSPTQASQKPLSDMKTDEDLLNLSIHHALFPTGNPDPLDPSSFHDLVSAATELAARFQKAYATAHKERAEAQAEASLRAEEHDEAETRARALRAQLEEMGRRVEEKEREVLRVKKLAEEEREARVRSLRIVSGQCEEGDEEYEEDVDDEDGELEGVRSPEVLSDSGFESGGDAGAASPPPSRPRKLQKAPTSAADGSDSKRRPPKPLQRSSTFERVVKGMPAHRREEARQAQSRLKEKERKTTLCESCTTGTEGSAWMRVSTLRNEKRELEMRIEELEGTVNGCLDIVAAMGV